MPGPRTISRRFAYILLGFVSWWLVLPTTSAAQSTTRIELGLAAPLGDAATLEALTSGLTRHLVWQAPADQSGQVLVRLYILRIDRGRVTASRTTGEAPRPAGQKTISAVLQPSDWSAAFRDCCLHAADPPVRVTAVSGSAYLDPEAFEDAVATVAREGRIGREFGIRPEIEISWGRQFVIVVSASSTAPLEARPLILLFERL